jgi:hypothetical protein
VSGANQGIQNREPRGGQRTGPTEIISDSRVPALERAQVAAASGQGDVEATALEVIAHGGVAVFEVRHFDAAAGTWHPARLIVTATGLAFLPQGPCEMGMLASPLTAVGSVQIEQSTAAKSGADLINIEVGGQQGYGGSARRLSLSGPLSKSAGPSAAPESLLLTHIRHVILGVQGHLQ